MHRFPVVFMFLFSFEGPGETAGSDLPLAELDGLGICNGLHGLLQQQVTVA